MSKLSDITENKGFFDGVTLAERMRECHTPAVSIALIEDNEISDVYTHGVKRKITNEKVTPDTLFQAASISKPVFAVAIMRLAERGILDINADIAEYLSDFDIPTYDNQKHKITLKQILSHYAGFNLHGFAGYRQGQRIPAIEQILTGAFPSNSLKLKLINKPGTSFQYSGGGYVLAQKICTGVCKRLFDDIMREMVLIPCSMTHSAYSQPLPKNRLDEIAFGYDCHNLQLPGGYNIMPELSAAGLWTTPSDLARFGIEIIQALNDGSLLLKKDSAVFMTSKAYENSPTGVGFFVGACKKGDTFEHGGVNYGYWSNMRFCPADGSGIVVMHNSDIGNGIIGEVVHAFEDAFGW